jgi:tetratricopeptide (TPR) repeat protein
MRHRRTLTIRRDDHTGEPIAALFLVSDMELDPQLRLVRDHLGPKLNILRLDLSLDRLEVEVEYTAHPREASHLAEAAAAIALKGAPRIALNLLKESLEMDPLNPHAILALAAAQVDLGRDRDALVTLRRAREINGDTPDLLRSLATVSLRLDLKRPAIEYLQLALELAPNDRSLTRMLAVLGQSSRMSEARLLRALEGLPPTAAPAPSNEPFSLDLANALPGPSDIPSNDSSPVSALHPRFASISGSTLDSQPSSALSLTPESKRRPKRQRLVSSRRPK